MRKPQLGVVMDPIAGINPAKDSSLAMLVEAQRRGYALWYFEQHDLRLRNGVAQGSARPLRVTASKTAWFELGPREELPLSKLDLIRIRNVPPGRNVPPDTPGRPAPGFFSSLLDINVK